MGSGIVGVCVDGCVGGWARGWVRVCVDACMGGCGGVYLPNSLNDYLHISESVTTNAPTHAPTTQCPPSGHPFQSFVDRVRVLIVPRLLSRSFKPLSCILFKAILAHESV